MAYEHPKHPYRPALFNGDYPPPTGTFDEIVQKREEQYREEMIEQHPSLTFEFARSERECLLRDRMSGANAQGWGRIDGALSPREKQRDEDYQTAERALRYGLPDAPGEAVAVAGGMPVKFR